MRRYLAWVVILVFMSVCLHLPALAHEEGSSSGKKLFTKHFGDSLFDVTENAAFSVEVLLDDSEYDIGKDVVGIAIHDDHDRDSAGAELVISVVLPDTGERTAVPVNITDRKNGLYIVSGLDLERKGTWELVIDVRKGKTEDSVRFKFPDVLSARHPKGKYSP